jgi:hypothetical protein
MTETYVPRHSESVTNKKEKAEKASFNERYGRAIGKAGISLFLGTQLVSSVMGAKEHDDAFYFQKSMLGVEQNVEASTLHDISDLMQRTTPGGPEMQKYENYRNVDAAADLRKDTAAEFGLHDIDPRSAQAELVKAKNLDDIDRVLASFSEHAGIKVSLLKSDQDMSAQLTGDDNSHIMAKYLRADATGETFTAYKANVINTLDGIASFPKEAFEETSDVLEQIKLSAGVYTPDDHKGGVYLGSRKSIYVPLTWHNGDQAAGSMRHEMEHVFGHEMEKRGLINFYNDHEFGSIRSNTTNPDDEYATLYAKTDGTSEDRADTLMRSFSELHPSFKLKSGTAFNNVSEALQQKEALIFTRIDKLKPGMGKFLIKTAPYSANSAVAYMPELSK